jgi:hypothetical protein
MHEHPPKKSAILGHMGYTELAVKGPIYDTNQTNPCHQIMTDNVAIPQTSSCSCIDSQGVYTITPVNVNKFKPYITIKLYLQWPC